MTSSGIGERIRDLGRECARDALAGTPPSGFRLVCDVDAKYFERLDQLLGRRALEVERQEFRTAFEWAIAAQQPSEST